jgi:hypothetical protein
VGYGLALAAGWVSYFSMVGHRPARGLYTLLTDPNLVGHNLLGNLCKRLVASLCNHTSVVWYDALQTPHGWVQSSSDFYATCGESVQPLQSVKLTG